MAQNGYQQYGSRGNPYGDVGQAESGYEQSNPYNGQGGDGTSNPYGASVIPPLQHGESQAHGTQPLSQQDFLARIDGTKSSINQLSRSIAEIANIHQRMLSSPDNSSSAQLESIMSETQIRNTSIKDEIKFLERDAAREAQNTSKKTQVEALKRTFRSQLEHFQKEESDYSKRYREAIARQYRIVNPEASEREVQEAAKAEWSEEGIFQQALKTNRSGQAASVLGAVRARHNDIQRIEKTLGELGLLFRQLDEQVVGQDEQVTRSDEQADQVKSNTRQAGKHLKRGIKNARRARKLKRLTLLTAVAILCIIAIALGCYFGLRNRDGGSDSSDDD